VFTVVGWSAILFLGFGLKSRIGAMSLVALAVGSVTVGSAAWLIVDLSRPYSGVFHASPAPLEQTLAYVSRGQGAVGASR